MTDTGALGLTPAAPTGDAVVSVLLGRGDGTFRPPLNTLVNLSNLTNLSGAGGPVFLGQPVVGDFNSDGRLDLAFAIQGNLAGTSAADLRLRRGGHRAARQRRRHLRLRRSSSPTRRASPSSNGGAATCGSSAGNLSGGTFFTPSGAGVVSIGSTNGIAFIPSGTASGFVVASPGVGIPGSGTIGLGTFGSGNVFGGPVDNGGSSFGDANGAFVATGLPAPAGGTALGVMLGTPPAPSSPARLGHAGRAPRHARHAARQRVRHSASCPRSTRPTFSTSLGALPTFGTPNTTGINTLDQSASRSACRCRQTPASIALATQSGDRRRRPGRPDRRRRLHPRRGLVVLRPVNFGSAGTLAGVPGFTSFAGGLPIGFSAAGPFVVAGDFNGDARPDLAVFNPAADSLSILLNTTRRRQSRRQVRRPRRPDAPAGGGGAGRSSFPSITAAAEDAVAGQAECHGNRDDHQRRLDRLLRAR